MRKRRGNAQFMTLLAIPLIIVVCLFWMSVKESNEADTSAGLEYIQGMESQDVQKVEQNLTNSKEESTQAPTEAPTEEPTEAKTEESTEEPTEEPTGAPTEESTEAPTQEPTQAPTEAPTQPPTEPPTEAPTQPPTEPPTEAPTQPPTQAPTEAPTEAPTQPPQPPVVQTQSYVPYGVDQERLAATLAQMDSVGIGSAEYLSIVKATYQDALFVGDSIVSGFSMYKVLNENNVIAKVGGMVWDHLPEILDSIVTYNPKVLFLQYGLNEMAANDAGVRGNVAQYKKCLQSLKDRLPNTKIIVLALGPVTDAAITKQARLAWIGTYNNYVKVMCQELGIGFYQNDQFFYDRMHLYSQKDGIHLQKAVYFDWIRDITKEVGVY